MNLPSLTEKDIADLKFGIENGFDYVAASFVRSASDVVKIRKVLEENGGEGIYIIAKIENQEGVDNIEEILEVSDGIMVARGDLGVEIPPRNAQCQYNGIPVFHQSAFFHYRHGGIEYLALGQCCLMQNRLTAPDQIQLPPYLLPHGSSHNGTDRSVF